MKVSPRAIPEVKIIEPQVFTDQRGFFMETWNQQVFAEAGIAENFVQDNHSRSTRGVLRGLHYQLRHPQGKLMRVISGQIFDVAVDLRADSPFFGKWVGEIISAENNHMLWLPAGFAHGFYIISEVADVVYKCTDFYDPEGEKTIRWDDPEIAIDWPLVNGEKPVVSDKDTRGSYLKDAETY